MRVFVDAVAVLAPGLPDWTSARAVMRGDARYAHAPMPPPAPASLAPAERRRSSPTVRLAIAVAEQALQGSSHRPEELAMVFSSYEAAGIITHQLCEVLAGSREVSPTQFHNSVHNAPSGYYSIAMNAKHAASSICRGEWSFAAGLLSAAAQVAADEVPLLYVCYDSPLPHPVSDVMPVIEATAIALVLTPLSHAGTLAGWDISLVDSCAAGWPAWMPQSWQANACSRGFPLLATLAGVAEGTILPLSPDLGLEVTRC